MFWVKIANPAFTKIPLMELLFNAG